MNIYTKIVQRLRLFKVNKFYFHVDQNDLTSFCCESLLFETIFKRSIAPVPKQFFVDRSKITKATRPLRFKYPCHFKTSLSYFNRLKRSFILIKYSLFYRNCIYKACFGHSDLLTSLHRRFDTMFPNILTLLIVSHVSVTEHETCYW